MNTERNTDDASIGRLNVNPEMDQKLLDNKLVRKENNPSVKASGLEKPNDKDTERWQYRVNKGSPLCVLFPHV